MTDPLPISPEIAGHRAIRMALPKGYACLRRREACGGFVGAACDTEPGSASLLPPGSSSSRRAGTAKGGGVADGEERRDSLPRIHRERGRGRSRVVATREGRLTASSADGGSSG